MYEIPVVIAVGEEEQKNTKTHEGFLGNVDVTQMHRHGMN